MSLYLSYILIHSFTYSLVLWWVTEERYINRKWNFNRDYIRFFTCTNWKSRWEREIGKRKIKYSGRDSLTSIFAISTEIEFTQYFTTHNIPINLRYTVTNWHFNDIKFFFILTPIRFLSNFLSSPYTYIFVCMVSFFHRYHRY